MWVDVGRRDVRLADSWQDMAPEPPGPVQPCRADGCDAPGAHDGLCGPHFWRETAYERQRVELPAAAPPIPAAIPPQYARLAEAYVLAADLLARLPEWRWVLLNRELDVSAPVLRRVRTIVSIAAGQPDSGLGLETDGQYRVMVTDRGAAARALEQAALNTHYWRKAMAYLRAAESAL